VGSKSLAGGADVRILDDKRPPGALQYLLAGWACPAKPFKDIKVGDFTAP